MRDEKFSGFTHPTFRTSRDATYAVKMAYQHNRQKIFWGGQPKRLRFLPPQRGRINTRFAAFFKIYQIIKLNFLKFGKNLQKLQHLQNCC